MNILIVDDEQDALADLARCMEKYKKPHSCTLCSFAPEALQRSEKTEFDVALLDIEMPVLNGIELAELLKDVSPGTKVIFISEHNNYATEAFRARAVDYILKPVQEERLFLTLDKLAAEQSHSSQITEPGNFSIQMFGKFVVKIGGEPYKWHRMKSAELLAYLLENRMQPIHKEKLCDLLWPDMEPKKALSNLQTVVYTVRRLLENGKDDKITLYYSDNCYTLLTKAPIADADKFENLLRKALLQKNHSLLAEAISLYTADYLEEEGWIWAEPRKEILRKKYADALKRLKK